MPRKSSDRVAIELPTESLADAIIRLLSPEDIVAAIERATGIAPRTDRVQKVMRKVGARHRLRPVPSARTAPSGRRSSADELAERLSATRRKVTPEMVRSWPLRKLSIEEYIERLSGGVKGVSQQIAELSERLSARDLEKLIEWERSGPNRTQALKRLEAALERVRGGGTRSAAMRTTAPAKRRAPAGRVAGGPQRDARAERIAQTNIHKFQDRYRQAAELEKKRRSGGLSASEAEQMAQLLSHGQRRFTAEQVLSAPHDIDLVEYVRNVSGQLGKRAQERHFLERFSDAQLEALYSWEHRDLAKRLLEVVLRSRGREGTKAPTGVTAPRRRTTKARTAAPAGTVPAKLGPRLRGLLRDEGLNAALDELGIDIVEYLQKVQAGRRAEARRLLSGLTPEQLLRLAEADPRNSAQELLRELAGASPKAASGNDGFTASASAVPGEEARENESDEAVEAVADAVSSAATIAKTTTEEKEGADEDEEDDELSAAEPGEGFAEPEEELPAAQNDAEGGTEQPTHNENPIVKEAIAAAEEQLAQADEPIPGYNQYDVVDIVRMIETGEVDSCLDAIRSYEQRYGGRDWIIDAVDARVEELSRRSNFM